MRILFLAGGGDVGGAKTHIISLAARLSQKDEVRLISFRQGAFAEEAERAGIDVKVIKTGFIGRDIRTLCAEYDAFKPDIVHSHGAKANMMAALLKRLRRAVTVTTIHSDYRSDYMGSPVKQMTFGTINTLSLRKIDYYIAVSDAFSKMLAERGFSPYRTFTIYNGVDFDRPVPKIDRTEYFARFGFDVHDGDVVAGIAARLTPIKDIPTLLRAASKAVSRAPSLKLAIAGDGEMRAELEAMTRSLGIEDRVCFLGWLDGTDEFFAACDIDVLCSLSESFPYALTEGVRAGCAAVSTRVGGVPRLIDDAVNGYIVEPGDADALADRLVTLVSDAELRCGMASRLLEKTRREFSIDAMADVQSEIYRTILRRGERPVRDGVVVCGAYGRGNAGDDAIQCAIVNEMRSIDPDMPITIMTRRPKETRTDMSADAIFIFNIPSFLRTVRRSKLFINGGGSLIQDVTSSRSLRYYLFTLRAAKKRGCKVMMYGCGIGPVNKKANRRLSAKTINSSVDAITLRDAESIEELERMGVTRPEILAAADPATGLEAAPLPAIDAAMTASGADPHDRYIGICLRSWMGINPEREFADAAEHAYKAYGLKALFIPAENPRDLAVSQRAAELTSTPCCVFTERAAPDVLIGVISRCECVLSMRLHPLIFAAGASVPFAAVSYDPKVEGFMKYMGNPLTIPLENADSAALVRLTDKLAKSDANTLRDVSALERVNKDTAARLLEVKS